MKVTSDDETIWANESYERLAATHGARVCAYREDNKRLADPLFKEAVKTAENILATVGWDLTTKTQLLSAGSRN